jgi:DNA polymerase III epsilon subunit-like protein
MSETIFFDFETGGVLPEQPSIQLAAIAVRDETGEELGWFEQKIVFEASKCDPEALKLNGWQAENWVTALSPAAVALKFSAFIEPYKCVEMISKKSGRPYRVAKAAGYNALTFDWPRLRALFGTSFLPVSYHVRDVLQRVIFWFDEHGSPPENFKLTTVCEHFGIETKGAHNALVDVRLTAALYRKMANTNSDFEKWWYVEGSGLSPLPGEDAEAHVHRVCKIAWGKR